MNRTSLAVIVAVALMGCAPAQKKSPDVSDSLRSSLDQAGLKNVSINQDRDKGVVTLGGHVTTDAEKTQAESIAKSVAADQIVANQVLVEPPGAEHDAKALTSDLDTGIEKNLDAVMLVNGWKDGVKVSVTGGVVTLTGSVNSTSKRAAIEKAAADVPNVRQVVDKIEVTDQKATSRGRGGD